MADPNGAASSAQAVEAPAKAAKVQPTEMLPTDRISFQKQVDIIRIFGVASGVSKKVVVLPDVEGIIKMKSSTISLITPFLVSIGLLQRADKGFLPSDAVMNFQRAWQWNPDKAAHKLAPVIQSTWFVQRLSPKLSYRGGISEDEAINDLAEASHASPEYKPRLSLLLDYMAVAGLILREGGQVTSTGAAVAADLPASEYEEDTDEMPSTPKTGPRSAVTTTFTQPTEGTVQFHVSVSVDMAEFAGWKADRIAAFFSGIAQVLAAKGAIEKNSAG